MLGVKRWSQYFLLFENQQGQEKLFSLVPISSVWCEVLSSVMILINILENTNKEMYSVEMH